MAGTFPGFVGVQQFDQNGVAMVGATLSIFDAVTNALVSVFADYGLTTPAANPGVADRAGRLPVVYVPDGMYRLRLANVQGITSNGGFDYPSVPSIGQQLPVTTPTLDPTGVNSTGDVKVRFDASQIPGWVRLNGQTIGNTYSGATERANADCQSLYKYAWAAFADALLPVVGGRGVSANADWAANKPLTLPSARGRTLVGMDGMGAALAGLITNFSTPSPDASLSTGGAEGVSLTEAQNGPHNHGGGGPTTGQSQDHTHIYQKEGPGVPYQGQGTTPYPASTATTGVATSGSSNDHTHTFSIPTDGQGAEHANMPPFITAAFFWKL